MSELSDLAEAVRHAKDLCETLENRSRDLSQLESSGRWEAIYSERDFRALGAANQQELKSGYELLRKAESALWSGVFSVAKTAHEARELKERATADADRKYSGKDRFGTRDAPDATFDRAKSEKDRELEKSEPDKKKEEISDWAFRKDKDEIPGR